MSSFFDLDISFDDELEPADLSKIPAKKLLAAIEVLPTPLKDVAMGILYERRTFSDVSQKLGIRQSELVTRLHRAHLFIAMQLLKN